MHVRKNGGMWFWRMGRLGGSVYLKAAPPQRWSGDAAAVAIGTVGGIGLGLALYFV